MDSTALNENTLALLGRKWKQASQIELECFRMAAEMGANTEDLLASATVFAEKLQNMSDLEAGAAVLVHFGDNQPAELPMTAANEPPQAPPTGTLLH